MMLCVNGSPLYQWDRNRQLRVDSVEIHSGFEVHCCHKDDSTSLVVKPIIEGNAMLVNIPNILLQRYGFLRVFVVVEGDTIFDTSLYVMARPKPDDYIYTETEVYTVEKAVEAAMRDAKESGEFDGADGYTPVKGVDYFTEEDKAELVDEVQEQAVGDLVAALENIIAIQESFMISDGGGVNE